jgi:hypothetical protein
MCDARAEAERFVALFDGDAPAKVTTWPPRG